MHVYQVEVFGKPTSSDILSEYENAARQSEQGWWEYYKLANGGQG